MPSKVKPVTVTPLAPSMRRPVSTALASPVRVTPGLIVPVRMKIGGYVPVARRTVSPVLAAAIT